MTDTARTVRWEHAARAAGREVDRNALRVYMAVATAERNDAVADAYAEAAAVVQGLMDACNRPSPCLVCTGYDKARSAIRAHAGGI